MKNIKVVVFEPGNKIPYTKTISKKDSGDEIRKAIGGWLELVSIQGPSHVYNLWINEEGKLKDLPRNCLIFQGEDTLRGTGVISKGDEEGEEVGLTDAEADYWISYIQKMKETEQPLF